MRPQHQWASARLRTARSRDEAEGEQTKRARAQRRTSAVLFTIALALLGCMIAAAFVGCSVSRVVRDSGEALVLSAADLERDLGVLERATVPAPDVKPEKVTALRVQIRGHVAAIGTNGAALVRLGEGGK